MLSDPRFWLWLLFVAGVFWIRYKRLPHRVKKFSFFEGEEFLWQEKAVELRIKGGKTRYKTIDLTVTNQRLLFAQFGYYEEIIDYTHPSPPDSSRFSGLYHCLPKSAIRYQKTFRGQQTLEIQISERVCYSLALPLTGEDAGDYASLFALPPTEEQKKENFLF